MRTWSSTCTNNILFIIWYNIQSLNAEECSGIDWDKIVAFIWHSNVPISVERPICIDQDQQILLYNCWRRLQMIDYLLKANKKIIIKMSPDSGHTCRSASKSGHISPNYSIIIRNYVWSVYFREYEMCFLEKMLNAFLHFPSRLRIEPELLQGNCPWVNKKVKHDHRIRFATITNVVIFPGIKHSENPVKEGL